MVACLGRRLHNASICLLSIAASLSVSASVVPIKTPMRPAQIPAAAQLAQHPAILLATPGSRFRASARTCLRPEVADPPNSIGRRSARRTFIFVEDTTPPFTGALKTARLQVPLRPQTPTPAASPALRNSFFSPSNRQRAP
ncbi:MAG: hypothetical protein ABSG84_16795 [Acidobacteriaceae bacterium]